MRIFRDFKEAKNEIARDLNELGVRVAAGYQSLDVEELKFVTTELQNYDYRVLVPELEDLEPKTKEWALAEWDDRLSGILGSPVNPGESWQYRTELWEPLLEKDGKFAYTYSERFAYNECHKILLAMLQHPNTRQAYISIWNPMVDCRRLGERRVPCSLGYHLMVRKDELHMTYHMRSSDFDTHFDNDCWLALMFLEYWAQGLQRPVGTFTHCISSLHVYQEKVEGIF